VTRFVAAVVTVIGGCIKAKADPRISPRPGNASLELAVTVAAARQDRAEAEAGIEAVRRAGRAAWQQRGGTS
jgi:hypothetical protein